VFSDWIRSLLASRGWTQQQAAQYLGFSQAQISGWLSGRTTPTLSSFQQIANRLHREPESVLGEVYGRSVVSGSVISLEAAIFRIEQLPPADRVPVAAAILERAVKQIKPDLDADRAEE